jgi:enoyl-CoA hydratase/carnithine racemase
VTPLNSTTERFGESGQVLLDRRTDHIALVTQNRPVARNAINAVTARALDSALLSAEADEAIWAVVLAGAGGKVFCAGADLKEAAQGKMPDLSTAGSGFAGFVYTKRRKPWIAAIEGLALPVVVKLHWHAKSSSRLTIAPVDYPSFPQMIAAADGLYRLSRIISRSIAMDLILTGDRPAVVRPR